ncbi:TPA: hypothetical protein EYP12_07865, partial [Candidatus Bipolaricaulota bacterium]|nr:hypothetical protein [Candidatus Bipolaricaulota bacterium]
MRCNDRLRPGTFLLEGLNSPSSSVMIGAKGEMLSSFFRGARNDFVRGLLVVLPFAATFYFLWLVYRSFVRLADA